MRDGPLRVVVMISGRGSNLRALIDTAAERGFRITGVISNRATAGGIAIARQHDIPVTVVGRGDDQPLRLHTALTAMPADLVVLAGYMQILPDEVVERFRGRMINIHPSLLPKYRGLHTHQRALDAGDEVHGASVHFVTPALDSGPVIARVILPVRLDDDADSLARRLLPMEHELLTACVELFARRQVEMRGQRVYIDGEALAQALVLEPGQRALRAA